MSVVHSAAAARHEVADNSHAHGIVLTSANDVIEYRTTLAHEYARQGKDWEVEL